MHNNTVTIPRIPYVDGVVLGFTQNKPQSQTTHNQSMAPKGDTRTEHLQVTYEGHLKSS